MNLWKKISYLGVSQGLDFRLTRRIVLANRFGLLIAIVTLIFMAIFLTRDNAPIIPLIGMLTVASCIWFLNAVELTRLSRFLTCLIPPIGLLALNISQKLGGAEVDILQYATPRMIIIGSLGLPFAIFTAFEKKYVWSAVAVILLLGFGYDFIHQWLGIDHQSLGIESKGYGIIFEDSIVLSLIVLAASGFMFSIGHQYDEKAQKLLDDALAQTDFLRKNEEDMKKTLLELEASRQKEEERSWIAKGVAELSEILQTADGSGSIYERWLASLIKYLGVNQGGLFISDEQDGEVVLNLVASYAYERKKFLQRTIHSGEGLVGQAFLEGDRIYLKQIPGEYVHITSGLGEATPRVLVLVPVKTSQSTEAVLELASFSELPPHHLELLDKLSESLASFIANNKVNQRTKKLLEQAQTMSEELKSNEEEMRQNLEELTATQEAMSRKEREYQQRIADLESALTASQIQMPANR
ncbi:MAG TPA: GAF domain-containing protein [Ohtaekwangia sp.]